MKSFIGSSLVLGGIASILWSLFGEWSFIAFAAGWAQLILGFVAYRKMD